MPEIIEIPCARIVPGGNDRKLFNQTELEGLAASIKAYGLAQPITVRPLSSDMFQIVAGERRFRAVSLLLGWETIPCIVRDLPDDQAAAVMLLENTGRVDLNPIEEANAYRSRLDRFGWSLDQVAEAAGVSLDLVRRRISLLRLAPEVQRLVAFSQLPIGHAEAMTDLDANRQRIALQVFQNGKSIPLAQFRHIVSELLAEQSQDSLFNLETFWVNQVQQEQDLPRRGKHAFTGAPTRTDLPPVEASPEDSTAAVIDRWISGLLSQGLVNEAAVAGTLYDALVRLNYLSVPSGASLRANTAADRAGMGS